jgi:hypothetical protein
MSSTSQLSTTSLRSDNEARAAAQVKAVSLLLRQSLYGCTLYSSNAWHTMAYNTRGRAKVVWVVLWPPGNMYMEHVSVT